MAQTETWKAIPEWPGYEASDLGRIRSTSRTVEVTDKAPRRLQSRMIRSFPNPQSGRAEVRLSHRNVKRTQYVAVLVLSAFVGPRPPGMETCHNDGDVRNDRLDNLRWDTHVANVQDTVQHGRHNGSKTHCKHGHPLSGDNLRISRRADGTIKQRVCRACEVAALARYAARKLAEIEAGEPRK